MKVDRIIIDKKPSKIKLMLKTVSKSCRQHCVKEKKNPDFKCQLLFCSPSKGNACCHVVSFDFNFILLCHADENVDLLEQIKRLRGGTLSVCVCVSNPDFQQVRKCLLSRGKC